MDGIIYHKDGAYFDSAVVVCLCKLEISCTFSKFSDGSKEVYFNWKMPFGLRLLFVVFVSEAAGVPQS